MILCYGEILADMIGVRSGDSVSYERHAGGAPFNAACAVARAGGESGFVGVVGNDVIGRFLLDFASRRGLAFTDIAALDDANTTLAFVELDERGERTICFYRKATADVRFSPKTIDHVGKASIVHLGSLMFSEEIGVKFARALAARCKKEGKTLSFDVNYREDIFPDAAVAVRAYSEFANAADIVKYSKEEIELFTGREWREALGFLARPGKLVCVTLGAKGCAYALGERTAVVPGIKARPVDTTGAGDAFYGALLSRLDGKNFAEMTDDELGATFRFANAAGAIATTARGAIDSLPSAEMIEKALSRGEA